MAEDAVQRIRCIALGCTNMIQPATAARTGGFCGPCDTKRKKTAYDEYVRTNRKDVDRFAGVDDPVELLRLIYTTPPPNPIVNLLPPPRSIEDIYLQLSKADTKRLLTLATNALQFGDFNLAKKVVQHLATFTEESLDSFLESCQSTNLVLPPVCFRGAGPKVRDGLVAAFRPTTTLLEADQLLSSLA